MATPLTNMQQTFLSCVQGQVAQLSFTGITDGAGDPLDMSTGYTAQLLIDDTTAPLTSASANVGGTFTYGNDGTLQLALTATQTRALKAGTYNMQLFISDDALVTRTIPFTGNLAVTRGLV